MIVRVLGVGQFRLGDADVALVERADDAVESAVAARDPQAFAAALGGLVDRILEVGEPVGDDEFVTSDVIVPDRDTTLGDAVGLGAASGEGLFPG